MPPLVQISTEYLGTLSQFERKELLDGLAALDEAVVANPLIRYNNPLIIGEAMVHRMQMEWHAAIERIRVYFGGNRAGKTTSGIVDDIIQACDRDVVPAHLQAFKRFEPPFKCRIVAPDFKRTIDQVIVEKLREWVPRSQLLGGNWTKAWSKDDHMLYFKNGSTFQLMSYEQDVDKFGGAALHRCHFDEEPDEDIRKECKKRLIDFSGDEVFTMTPQKGLTWMREGIWKRRHEPGFHVAVVDMDDNPWLTEEDKEWALDGLTDLEKQAAKSGRMVHFGGLVLDPEFNDTCVIPPIHRESIVGQDIVIGIDPGIRNTGVAWMAFDDDNCGVVFESHKFKDTTIDVVSEEIFRISEGWGIEEPAYYVIDPSARNRTQMTNAESVESEFQRNGIYPLHGQNDLEAGIFQLKRRFRSGQLLICNNNVDLLDEIDSYRIDDKASSYNVIKINDHVVDCLVAGTMIETDRGAVPIEHVTAADHVLTRQGYRRVLISEPTRVKAVRTLTFDDGRTLTGSDEHPVWVEDRGWVDMDSVRYGDIVCSCPKSSSITASSSAGIPTPSAEPIASTSRRGSPIRSAAFAGCMKKFGWTTTGRSRRATTSTTSTATRTTTTRRIWTAFLRAITYVGTTPPSAAPRRLRAWTRFDRSRAPGMGLTPALSGIAVKDQKHGTLVPRSANTSASTAAKRSPREPWGARPAFARTTANPLGAAPAGSTMKTERASSAARSSESTNIHAPRTVPTRVVANRRAGRRLVFNLTVEDVPEFFANGILVHNCVRYLCMSRPWIGEVKLKKRGFTPRDDFGQLFQERGRQERETPPLGVLT